MHPALLLVASLLCAGSGFTLFTAKGDGFSTEFPGKPDVEMEKGETGVLRRVYSAPTDDGGSLLVRVVTVADGEPASGSALDVDAIIRAEGGEVMRAKAIALGGLEGREVFLEGAPLDKLLRVYHGKHQLYLAVASFPHGTKLAPGVQRHFFDSFKIFGVAPEDQARPADGVFANIEELKVKDRVTNKNVHEARVDWVVDVRVEPGDAAVTLEATCRCGGKVTEHSYPQRVGPGKKGQRVRMSQTLYRMKGEIAHCDLSRAQAARRAVSRLLARARGGALSRILRMMRSLEDGAGCSSVSSHRANGFHERSNPTDRGYLGRCE